MSKLGFRVPPGFTITTAVCKEYNDNGNQLPGALWQNVLHAIREVEDERKSTFGGSEEPLLFSVRSGAAASMPGMMVRVFTALNNRSTCLESLASADMVLCKL
jgi:pyruvate,orthophosphate dikinase